MSKADAAANVTGGNLKVSKGVISRPGGLGFLWKKIVENLLREVTSFILRKCP